METGIVNRTRAPDWKHDRILQGFILYWCIHIGVWGLWGWRESELFHDGKLSPNGPWWFDFAGHAWAGVVGAINDMYLYSRRREGGLQEVRYDLGDLHLTKGVVADVGLAGIAWEGLERIWDWLIQPNIVPWVARAQKDVVDNMIDLMTNPFFALLTLLCLFAGGAIFDRWIRKQASRDEQLAQNAVMLMNKIESLDAQLAELVLPLKETKRELIRQFIRKRRERFRAFLRAAGIARRQQKRRKKLTETGTKPGNAA